MKEDFAGIGASLRPLLVASGNSEEDVDRWILEQEAEVREMKVKTYIKVSKFRIFAFLPRITELMTLFS